MSAHNKVAYKPATQDIRFAFDVLNIVKRAKDIPNFKDVGPDEAKMVVDNAVEFAVKHAAPLNQLGDTQGCTHEMVDGVGIVKTPADPAPEKNISFKNSYDKFCNVYGLAGISGSTEYGGGGMPRYLELAVSDIGFDANFSMMMPMILTGGATKVMYKFASEALKNQWLPKMYSGKVATTMCLTEGDYGTDLGAIKTKAIQNDDGSYQIEGNKIFITYGEHDLTKNIAHLVLARDPSDPDGKNGAKGVSLYLVPKLLENGERNGVLCTAIEEKMGLHGSPTCQMSFNSKGWLIGEPNKGLEAMFVMMNDARIKTGQQGISLVRTPYQIMLDYAMQRKQGGQEIIKHGNVMQDLVSIKAELDGLSFLNYDLSVHLDIADWHPDAAKRAQSAAYASVMTPIAKASMTNFGCTATQRLMHSYGGMGYIRDTGIEQYYRDAAIAPIYEGTNDIQALDLVNRKAFDKDGRSTLDPLFKAWDYQRQAIENKDLKDACENMRQAQFHLGYATAMMQSRKSLPNRKEEIKANARDYLAVLGKVAVGMTWLNVLNTIDTKPHNSQFSEELYEQKRMLGKYYLEAMVLPDAMRHAKRIENANTLGGFTPEKLAI